MFLSAVQPDTFSRIIDMIIIPTANHCLCVIFSWNMNTPAAPARTIAPTLNKVKKRTTYHVIISTATATSLEAHFFTAV